MGMWDLHQELRIRNVRANQRSLESQTRARDGDLQQQVWALEDRVERLLIVTEAMWELLGEAEGVTEEQLLARCAEVDGRSGETDGRRARDVRRCQACEAAVPHGRPTCAFCGVPVAGGVSAFDRV